MTSLNLLTGFLLLTSMGLHKETTVIYSIYLQKVNQENKIVPISYLFLFARPPFFVWLVFWYIEFDPSDRALCNSSKVTSASSRSIFSSSYTSTVNIILQT